MKEFNLSANVKDSLDILETLNEEGLMVMPIVPTPQMVEAGMQVSGLSAEEVKKLYFTMITFSDEEIPMRRQ